MPISLNDPPAESNCHVPQIKLEALVVVQRRDRQSIVDSDNITISGTKVRLGGIDSPERNQTGRKASVTWKCGYEATETLRHWIYTKEVRCIGDTKDCYGRLMADWLVDGYNVNVRPERSRIRIYRN